MKDRKGIDIREGDIMKAPFFTGIVEFEKEGNALGVWITDINMLRGTLFPVFIVDHSDWEISGNIHEEAGRATN